ncbi:tryptophan synthase beta chain 1-like [Lactuca sativa]|uniref:Uncharacterized protein n=2 Tax=Lactuca sativa TaxID=4236 RepID=A0A9R1UZF6_LACSA|nr:tryptophan synthase beta chain 1-like [Lactuca sativa]XP_052621848.1 tryptophan synthase beta chain 1-like [Lactuca sativa]KAJ0196378.1 hypothetical protein LSAT_V11C700384940 [Lactuca sativa]KAJ0197857.1 hypothetical protein LSAT_V11C700384950 [Lactuca sativa]
MVSDFHKVIGKEIREQSLEMWVGKPDVILAYVGGGSLAIGMFHEFLQDPEVKHIGVQISGRFKHKHHGNFWKDLSTLKDGEPGLIHGALTYILMDDEDNYIHDIQISDPRLNLSRSGFRTLLLKRHREGGVRMLKEERIKLHVRTAHVVTYLNKLCPTLADGFKIVIGCKWYLSTDVDD